MLSLSLTWITACAPLPEYAKPHRIQIDEIPNYSPTGFTYRQLTPGDFRAALLPENLSTHGERINAQSAIQIRLTADSSFSITRWPFFDQINYTENITHLAFEAVMIPNNSWWSPRIKAEMTGYVLQHEQIHFALTELAARKLTRDAQKWASNLLVIRETPQEVHSEVLQQIKDMINSAMEANQKRHEEFDEDTSLFYNPSWQAWWLETVEKELKQTESGSDGRGESLPGNQTTQAGIVTGWMHKKSNTKVAMTGTGSQFFISSPSSVNSVITWSAALRRY